MTNGACHQRRPDPGSASVGYGSGERRTLPSFVPARYAPLLARAAQRWSVGAALLAAQLYAESNFNPFAQSAAGAQGIAQFTPSTAAAYGLSNPYDPAAAIDACQVASCGVAADRRVGVVAVAQAAAGSRSTSLSREGELDLSAIAQSSRRR